MTAGRSARINDVAEPYVATFNDLDIRSPKARKVYQNRVAKELQKLSSDDLRMMVFGITAVPQDERATLTRQKAIGIIAQSRIDRRQADLASGALS